MFILGRILDLLHRQSQLLSPQQLPSYYFDSGRKNLFIIQLNLNKTTATSKVVYVRQDGRYHCHPLLLRNYQLLVRYPVTYRNRRHFSILFIEQTSLLSAGFVVYDLDTSCHLEIGILWVIEILVYVAAIENSHVIVEGQCDIFTPLEGM